MRHWILLILVSFLPLIALTRPGLPATHDGQDQVARVANFYQSLSEGNLLPRWAGNLNWGYGHPVLMFLYPLPSYLASGFHVLGWSLVDSVKLVFGLAFIASVLAMYLWLAELVAPGAALVGAVLYGFAPYRFVDLYVRGAIGEHLAFVWLPLALWGLLQLGKAKTVVKSMKSTVLVSFSIAGLFLSHNALSLMFMPVIIGFLGIISWLKPENKRFIWWSGAAIGMGLVLSAWFLVPAFVEGKYTLRDIVTRSEYASRFLSWVDFFRPNWNFGGSDTLSKQLGLAHWALVILAGWVFKATKDKKLKLFIAVAGIGLLLSLFLMTDWSVQIWQRVTILQKFQFPWRFLSLGVFFAAVLGSIGASFLFSKISRRGQLIVVLFLVSLTLPMWRAAGYLNKSEDFYRGIYPGTTDTGESSPIWSVRFMEKGFGAPLEVISGVAKIIENHRSSTQHSYIVKSVQGARLVENTLYFPGWKIFVDQVPIGLQFQDPEYRGLMTFQVGPGEHQVLVKFGNTRVRWISEMISFIGIIIVFAGFLFIGHYDNLKNR